ncbi:hypothetical protein GMO_11630 [Gluconobacter morbifer G707]|uniref:Uncharacterized protein n=1 Tax=Gluconobacter morbifer G707 TaxID=1088869 RepID=G6XIW3_9PROT|nr:hypothetical protein GMO_11630 [Gluconobacter morbifer G707]
MPPVLPVWASENLSDRIAFIRETRLIFGEADALWAWEQMGMPLPPMWEASLEDIVAGQKNMSYAEAVGDCMDSVQKYRIRDSEPQLPGQRKGASQKEVAQERITITRTVKKQ